MTRFHVEMTLVCPSDWTPELHCRAYVERILPTKEEKESLRVHAMNDDCPNGTYPAPPYGWTCFHCGETFGNPNLAKAHFGDGPRERPACVLIQERGMLYELREAQRERAEATQRAIRAEEQLEVEQGIVAEYQRILRCSSAHDCRMQLDSVEGRALTSELLVEFALKCGVLHPDIVRAEKDACCWFSDREDLYAALEKTLPTPPASEIQPDGDWPRS